MTLTEAKRNFLRHCGLMVNLSQNTLRAYESDLDDAHRYLGQRRNLEDVRAEHLRGYIEHMRLQRHLKETTVKRRLASLKLLFIWARREELINDEAKLRDIPEARYLRFLRDLREVGGLAFAVAANVSLHDQTSVERHQQLQANKIGGNARRMIYESGRQAVTELRLNFDDPEHVACLIGANLLRLPKSDAPIRLLSLDRVGELDERTVELFHMMGRHAKPLLTA
jgi:Phage integrase, N-terminal SAM-like domain